MPRNKSVVALENFLFSEKYMRKAINSQCLLFEYYLKKIQKSKSLDRRMEYAKQALNIANNGSTRYYSSDIIESVFLELAQKNKTDLSKDVIPNSVLHVASELYESGGHSRILERWIQESPKNQTNTLFLTRHNHIPESVLKVMSERNRQIIQTNKNSSDIKTAMLLRKIASKYERIILHVHMDDYIPIIAFGCNEFHRPVYLFNHADHRFWLGVSIADKVLNFRKFGKNISEKYRGVKKTFFIPLLNNNKKNLKKFDIKKLKEKLGIPKDNLVLFTAGSGFKYKPLLDFDFNKFLDAIIDRIQDITIVAIGPKLTIKNTDNLVNLPSMPYAKFNEYLLCADVVIDSFPFSGGTGILDAISANKPVLCLECPTGHTDYLMKSSAYCHTMSEIIDKTCELINSAQERKKNIQNVKHYLEQENLSVWKSKCNSLYNQKSKHHITSFHSVKTPINALDFFMFQNTCDIKHKIHIPYILDLYRIKIGNKKHYMFMFFNFRYSII